MRYFIVRGFFVEVEGAFFCFGVKSNRYPNLHEVEKELDKGKIHITNIIELNGVDYDDFFESEEVVE